MAEQLKREVFGTTKDGETVYRVEIKGGGLTAKIMTWGAVIQDLRLDGHEAPLLLGFDNFADYPAYSCINTNGSVILHGAYVGGEFCW